MGSPDVTFSSGSLGSQSSAHSSLAPLPGELSRGVVVVMKIQTHSHLC